MRAGKRILAVMLTVVLVLGSAAMTSYAANKKITSVSIEIESDIQMGGEIHSSEVSATSKSDWYYVTSVVFTNEGFEWGEEDIPTVEIGVEAADGYYFSVDSKNVKIKGGKYSGAKKEGSNSLRLTVTLPSLKERAGKITQAGWESETVASWSEVANAGIYEVRVYRDGTSVKGGQTSSANRLDMARYMTKAGIYSYKVRAINKINADNKSEWVESAKITVSNELAARMREQNGNITTGLSEPGEVYGAAQEAGWVQDAKGWWYRNENGSYPANDWMMLDGLWYYFNSDGYMGTGWILWKDQWYYCDLSNGHMLTSSLTPDGLRVDSQGVWIQ